MQRIIIHCCSVPSPKTPPAAKADVVSSQQMATYKAKLNCKLLLLKSIKINPGSPAGGSSVLSYWTDNSWTHRSGYFFWIKRVFFNLLDLWQSHPFCLGVAPWVSRSSFQRSKDSLQLLREHLNSLRILQILKFYMGSRGNRNSWKRNPLRIAKINHM